MASAERSMGLGSRPAVCRGGLRTGDALQGCVEGSREGPTAFIVWTARPSGRGDRSAFAGGLSRRRDAVSRRRVTVLFGAPEGVGSLRSSSFGAWSTVRARRSFPRRRDAVSRQRVTVLFGALERADSSRSGSSEPGRRPEFVDRFHPEAQRGLALAGLGALRRAGASRQLEVGFFGAWLKVRGCNVFPRRRGAVSRWCLMVLFGAPEGVGILRSSSSELVRWPGVVKRFHGGVDASPCGLADEFCRTLRRCCGTGSSSSELGAG